MSSLAVETARINLQAFAMFATLCAGTASENIFLSPFSICGAFGLAYSGAVGKTASEIADALGLPSGVDECGQYFSTLMSAYKSVEDIKIYVSNSIWADQRVGVLAPFLDTVKKYYGGEFYQEDFTKSAATAQKINTYVENNTNEMIKNLLSPENITPDTAMVLLNTLYFDANWENAFNKEATSEQPFHLFSGGSRPVNLMYQKTTLAYFSDSQHNVHGVVLPYKNRRFALVALMPENAGSDQGKGALDSIVGCLGEKLDSWLGGSRRSETQLWMPKTKLDYKTSLVSLLQSLGIKEAFTGSADFSGIDGKRTLAISDVIHQTALEMDETSTRAAAATAVIMCLTSMRGPPRPKMFRADRPFLVLIRDQETGLVLFVGRVNDPGLQK